MKKLRYMFEATLLWLAFLFFRTLSVEKASAIGGAIGQSIGPRLSASRKALRNIKHAMPGRSDSEYDSILRDMWNNLGRVIAEYPHLKEIIYNNTDITGYEHLKALAGQDKPLIIIGAHMANWELFPFFFNYKADLPITGVYRAPNNPYTAELLDRCRNPEHRGLYVPKSQRGTKQLVKELRKNGRVGFLIDQKYNQGIPVPFFGRPAMTGTAFAQLAKKFDCPILPIRLERLQGAHFRLTIYEPMHADGSDYDVTLKTHKMMEQWINERPAQWLWLHRRWDSKFISDQPPSHNVSG